MISKAGYLHIPLLYFGSGSNGFILRFPFFDIEVSWGEASRKHYAIVARLKRLQAYKKAIKYFTPSIQLYYLTIGKKYQMKYIGNERWIIDDRGHDRFINPLPSEISR